MGTRGAIGFILNDTPKITYNHFDSYPTVLGVSMLAQAATFAADLPTTKKAVKAVKLIDDSKKPTAAQLKLLAGRAGITVPQPVSTGTDWYAWLRDAQGDLAAYLKIGYMPNSWDFPLESLFCEYAYIIDLDAGVFEAYVGYQTADHADGRFGPLRNESTFVPNYAGATYYAPVRLMASWSLTNLPTPEEFLRITAGIEASYRLERDPKAYEGYEVSEIPVIIDGGPARYETLELTV